MPSFWLFFAQLLKKFLSLLPRFEKKEDYVFSRSLERKSRSERTDVRVVAFYLPQFHRIPENDVWWGEGFTEWTNVQRGKPWFLGHYQPHIPHPDVGYYDLYDDSVMEKQVAMAKYAGISGFCFYHYWFSGRRLLEMPVERMLKTKKPDFPFCLLWVNENWTRRWDGKDEEVLITQNHADEDEAAFVEDIVRAFQDPRYIRINNRPLFLVYRPLRLPRPLATFDHWRALCRAQGIGEIYLAGVFSYEIYDPLRIGLDAAVEFPPLQAGAIALANNSLNSLSSPSGWIYDYRTVKRNMIRRKHKKRYIVYRGVMPSWDHTSRFGNKSHVFINSSPESYYSWLKRALQLTRTQYQGDHRIVFINAWNEWGEGCHLEPDERYGYAWLNATRSAIYSTPKE